jgi:hypothetical protein
MPRVTALSISDAGGMSRTNGPMRVRLRTRSGASAAAHTTAPAAFDWPTRWAGPAFSSRSKATTSDPVAAPV